MSFIESIEQTEAKINDHFDGLKNAFSSYFKQLRQHLSVGTIKEVIETNDEKKRVLVEEYKENIPPAGKKAKTLVPKAPKLANQIENEDDNMSVIELPKSLVEETDLEESDRVQTIEKKTIVFPNPDQKEKEKTKKKNKSIIVWNINSTFCDFFRLNPEHKYSKKFIQKIFWNYVKEKKMTQADNKSRLDVEKAGPGIIKILGAPIYKYKFNGFGKDNVPNNEESEYGYDCINIRNYLDRCVIKGSNALSFREDEDLYYQKYRKDNESTASFATVKEEILSQDLF